MGTARIFNFLGNRKSYSQYEQEMKTLFFESKSEAEARTLKRKAREELGEIKKKRHSPEHDKMNFDRNGLLDKVKSSKESKYTANMATYLKLIEFCN